MKHERCSSMTNFGVSMALAVSILCLSAPLALSETVIFSKNQDEEIVQEKRVRNAKPGTLRYQSSYVMTKDKQGTYRTTFHSQKKEWFCCLDWFSSPQEKGAIEELEVKRPSE